MSLLLDWHRRQRIQDLDHGGSHRALRGYLGILSPLGTYLLHPMLRKAGKWKKGMSSRGSEARAA